MTWFLRPKSLLLLIYAHSCVSKVIFITAKLLMKPQLCQDSNFPFSLQPPSASIPSHTFSCVRFYPLLISFLPSRILYLHLYLSSTHHRRIETSWYDKEDAYKPSRTQAEFCIRTSVCSPTYWLSCRPYGTEAKESMQLRRLLAVTYVVDLLSDLTEHDRWSGRPNRSI